jgi:hypothetical protein
MEWGYIYPNNKGYLEVIEVPLDQIRIYPGCSKRGQYLANQEVLSQMAHLV